MTEKIRKKTRISTGKAPENRAKSGSGAVFSCRTVAGQFAKGHSGNPGGRPRDLFGVQELARSYAVEAIETLVAVMRADNAGPRARIAAAIAILDRGFGRPTQTVYSSPGHIDPDKLSDAELVAMIMADRGDDDSATEDNDTEAEADPRARRPKKPN
jgi:hypothetical protein